jgi:carboxypeptidase family protein
MTIKLRSATCMCILVIIASLAGCSQSTPPARQVEAAKATTQAKPVIYYKVDPATAGTVTGKIVFTGKAPARKKINMDEDPLCAKLHKTAVYDVSAEVGRKGALANAFVYIKTGLEGKKFEPPADPVVIDQHGCWFAPRVIGMQTGQALKAVNSDPVTHNIHPRAKINREWNQNQPEGAEPAIRKFAWPEVMIRVKCNIHAWMKAWIGVVDNPYFAVTGENGSFEFKNVPPGTYTVEAWQEDLGTQDQQVTVPASGKAAADFTFKGE